MTISPVSQHTTTHANFQPTKWNGREVSKFQEGFIKLDGLDTLIKCLLVAVVTISASFAVYVATASLASAAIAGGVALGVCGVVELCLRAYCR